MNRIALILLIGLGCDPTPRPSHAPVRKLSDGTCVELVAEWNGCTGDWAMGEHDHPEWVKVECVHEQMP